MPTRHILAGALMALLVACGGGDEAGTKAPEVNPIVARSLQRDPGPPDEYGIIVTNYGDIKVRFFPRQAPLAVANFKGLAAKGFYNGLTFHRIVRGWVIQAGDPNGDGTGGQSLWGGYFRDEFHPAFQFSRPGMLAMANRGKHTNGSQFFITLDQTPELNGKHTIFGEVMEGMDVAYAIADVPVNEAARPVEPVVIEEIRIVTE